MENLKENLKEIERIKKETYKTKEQIKQIEELNTFELYKENLEQFKSNDNKIKALKNKIELNDIKIAILKNNLHYLLKMDFEGIKSDMLYYYNNKNIGEKTKQKMENEIKEYFKSNYNVAISCYISLEITDYNNAINFNFCGFLDKEGFNNHILEYNEDFKITFEKRKYNNYELQIIYNLNIDNYIELKDITETARKTQKEYLKAIEKIEKLRLQQKEIYHNFTDYIHGFLYYKLKIDTNITIY